MILFVIKKRNKLYQKNAGGGISMPPCILGKSDENSRKIVADKAVYTIDKNKELG